VIVKRKKPVETLNYGFSHFTLNTIRVSLHGNEFLRRYNILCANSKIVLFSLIIIFNIIIAQYELRIVARLLLSYNISVHFNERKRKFIT